MFWIRYTDTLGNQIEHALDPAPNDVDYPEVALFNTMTTQDGAVIVQRPLLDARPRKWIWRGYGQPDAAYMSQWTLLQALNYRARLRAGLTPTIEIWEDVTGAGGFDRLDGLGAKVWTRVKLLQTTRKPVGPGPVRYESTVEFYIQDANYNQF